MSPKRRATKRRKTAKEGKAVEMIDEPTEEGKPPKKNAEKEDDAEDESSLLMLAAALEEGGDSTAVDDEAKRQREERRKRWQTLNTENDDDIKMENDIQPANDDIDEEQDDAINEHDAAAAAKKGDDDEDDFDMFSSSVSPVAATKSNTTTKAASNTNSSSGVKQHELDYDDAEGYYKSNPGEVISLGYASYKVLGTVGKGVFSTVLKCSDTSEASSEHIVAVKCVRANETMAKAAQTEIEILQIFQKNPHPHIVPMIVPTPSHPIAEHKGHRLLVFEYYAYNLRDVLQKFGKGVGLSLVSVRMYFGQMLSALHHMQNHHIVHADIKLDNMLVTNDFTAVKICDFGSAMDMRDSGNNIPTPYLVSRFYRAPEIILGHTPAFTMDLWSVAVTVAELFLGRVLFNGTSNNDMLLKIMQVLGPLPLKQIKHHTLACRTYPLPQHFSEHHFLEQATDAVTGNPVQKQVSLQQFPTKPLQSLLLKAKSSSDSRVQVLQLSDLLKKCLALDPTRRISLKDAMKHDFFQKSSSIGPKENKSDK